MSKTLRVKKPIEYRRGDRISFESRTWLVTDYTVSPGGQGYEERQWTLQEEKGHQVVYLLFCLEMTDQGEIEKWIATRQIELSAVCQNESSQSSFDDMLPSSPPEEVVCGGIYYKLKESYTVEAKDDEGNLVPKETWDYFDGPQGSNLAIEIWREPDGNYPEAYLGKTVEPELLKFLGTRSVTGIKLSKVLWGAFIGFCGGLFMGIPGDYMLTLLMPGLVLISAFALSIPSFVLVLAIGGSIGFLAMFIFSSLPGLLVGLIFILFPTVFVQLSGSFWEDSWIDHTWVPTLSAVLATLIYGLAMYHLYAPRPHCPAQLFATLLWPALIGAITLIVNWGISHLWSDTASNV